MPKAERGTPKEIANRCKSKGLQKLRWYCEMCQKQCRDQNGFKCHLMSENHQRQLLLFAENQKAYLSQFSRDFEANFMHVLRHTFGTKRVRANEVYQEYIKDKKHVHMNSTVWHTLTGFVLYLGESGKCKIDENEKGWHIKYIDQEEELRKQKALKRAKNEKDDEDKMNELLQRRIEKALEKQKDEEEITDEPKELVRKEGETIKFSLSKNTIKPVTLKPSAFNPLKPPALKSSSIQKNIKREEPLFLQNNIKKEESSSLLKNVKKEESSSLLKNVKKEESSFLLKNIKKEEFSPSKHKERYENYYRKKRYSNSSNEEDSKKKKLKKSRDLSSDLEEDCQRNKYKSRKSYDKYCKLEKE